jgi:hypothetical protein
MSGAGGGTWMGVVGPTYAVQQELKLFASGSPITAAMPVFPYAFAHEYGHGTHGSGGNFGVWPASTPGFAGFRLSNGDLGWIELEWWNGTIPNFPGKLEAFGWAINTTPGEGIYAGTLNAVKAVPEPGTLALSLLAFGAAGIAAWRKTRRRD